VKLTWAKGKAKELSKEGEQKHDKKKEFDSRLRAKRG